MWEIFLTMLCTYIYRIHKTDSYNKMKPQKYNIVILQSLYYQRRKRKNNCEIKVVGVTNSV